MRLADWFAALRALHEKACHGTLKADELSVYRDAREELASMLLAAQRLTLKSGEIGRETLRVVRHLPLELSLADGHADVLTLDISSGGFSAVLPRAPRAAEHLRFSLQLTPPLGALVGSARVASVLPEDGAFRASFTFEGLSPADTERVNAEVLETALEHLGSEVVDGSR